MQNEFNLNQQWIKTKVGYDSWHQIMLLNIKLDIPMVLNDTRKQFHQFRRRYDSVFCIPPVMPNQSAQTEDSIKKCISMLHPKAENETATCKK